jgi:queuine tRNA-ribosyltransferase
MAGGQADAIESHRRASDAAIAPSGKEHEAMAPEKPPTLQTAHGPLRLPAFLPDATRGVVRCVDSADLTAAGVQGLVACAFHLARRPGGQVVRAAGGLHRFMGWQGPLAVDSGGFQVFSLLRESPKLGGVTKQGFHYRLAPGEGRKLLTPAKCIRQQFRLGADVMVCLDHCTHGEAPADVQRQSVRHTIDWARRCKDEFERLAAERPQRPILFAVVQGGRDPELRRRCAEALVEIGFDGYAFGGWPIVGDNQLSEMVDLVAEVLRPHGPLWALGIGKPEHVVAAARLGYGLMDCVIPTRDARHRRLYVWRDEPAAGERFYEQLYIQDEKHTRDGAPVDERCDCACCRRYSRAYLHHLFRVGDGLAPRLATIHNLRFYTRLMASLRAGEAGGAAPRRSGTT